MTRVPSCGTAARSHNKHLRFRGEHFSRTLDYLTHRATNPPPMLFGADRVFRLP